MHELHNIIDSEGGPNWAHKLVDAILDHLGLQRKPEEDPADHSADALNAAEVHDAATAEAATPPAA